jgi:hypothetical protein
VKENTELRWKRIRNEGEEEYGARMKKDTEQG